MEYRAHRLGGMCAGAILATSIYGTRYFSLENPDYKVAIGTLVLVTAGAIGSLMPDIDHPNSYISKQSPILSFFVKIFLGLSRIVTKIILSLCFWISKRRKEAILAGTNHRGIFHTLLMVIAMYFLFGLIGMFIPDYGRLIQLGFTGGYLSHIMVDMLTKGGVMLLYPIVTVKFHWPFIRLTTGKHEGIAMVIIIFTTIISILYLLK